MEDVISLRKRIHHPIKDGVSSCKCQRYDRCVVIEERGIPTWVIYAFLAIEVLRLFKEK
jgi:hypothetical protein